MVTVNIDGLKAAAAAADVSRAADREITTLTKSTVLCQ